MSRRSWRPRDDSAAGPSAGPRAEPAPVRPSPSRPGSGCEPRSRRWPHDGGRPGLAAPATPRRSGRGWNDGGRNVVGRLRGRVDRLSRSVAPEGARGRSILVMPRTGPAIATEADHLTLTVPIEAAHDPAGALTAEQ